MMNPFRSFCAWLLLFTSCTSLYGAEIELKDSSKVDVVVAGDADVLIKTAASLLVSEVKRRCPNANWGVTDKPPSAGFHIAFSQRPENERAIKDSFSIKVAGNRLEIRYQNPRAAIFAVGEVLLKSSIYENKIVIPEFDISRHPRFPIRGFRDAGPMPFFRDGHFDKRRFRGYMQDIALWGGNMFVEERNWVPAQGVFQITDSLGFDLGLYFPSNSIGRVGHRVDPNDPANHQQLLDQFSEFAGDYPHLELWSNATIDNGGWFSKETFPWGQTHLELVKEEAAILRKTHPQMKVVIQYQLSHHMEEAELKAIRKLVNGDESVEWFNYFGPPVVNYPVFSSSYTFDFLLKKGIRPVYTDLFTHWDKQPFNKYGGVPLPYDTNLWNRGLIFRTVYSRRGGPALMPQRLKGMIQQLEKWEGDGAAPYNHGGLHDDLSKYYSIRLLWNPEADLEVLSKDFARLYFGPAAAPSVAKALLLMETNWAKPPTENDDIQKVHALLEKAYQLTPESYRDWNWRLHALRFRATVDNMIYIATQTDPQVFEEAFHREVMSFEEAEESPQQSLAKGLSFLAEWERTKIMPLYAQFDEDFAVSQECDRKVKELILWHPGGHGLATVDKLKNLISRNWVGDYRSKMQKALTSSDRDIQLQVVANTINYQYAGASGFYNYASDDGGKKHPNMQGMIDNSFDVALSMPGLRSGSPWRFSQRLSGGRLVNNRLHDWEQVMTYTGLKKGARYRFKFSHLGGFQAKYEKGTMVYLNGQKFEVPPLNNKNPRTFAFDIPSEYTEDSKLVVRLVSPPYQVWRTMTESWLYPVIGDSDYRLPISIHDIEEGSTTSAIKTDGWEF